MKKTKLGQHFLIDNSVIEKELFIANLSTDDVVLEIGPGKGVLTQKLAERVRQVIAIELDNTLYHFLKQVLPENVLLIHQDIMDLSWDDIPFFTKVVANLPYQISSPVTFKLFEVNFEKAVLIYQKEFAERMIACSGSKDYSRLSVGIRYKSKCKIHMNIPPKSFSPPPKVMSSLVELIPYEKPPFHIVDESFFFEVTKQLFSHRRKQIGTILKNSKLLPYNEDLLFLTKRVEELTPQEIGLLSNQLYEIIS
ncbi:MAG TPA: 16S rRNA (adenine(1518)-N(6)/adenine(1519)-N(6))-dimethyltransferase RsmA [Candidatus Thermoplasmatota archaeon]|nr:16S rRNA (adenine(1518)-N(6)/adenine(1519)-N(6))-dimethyltransferase RsmA [Candidatus Thermoplasmatota archaeon]